MPELSRYIHLDSVRSEVRQRPEGYASLSYQNYIGQQVALGWMQGFEILSFFDGDKKRDQAFVEDGLALGVTSPLAEALPSTILGHGEFVRDHRVRMMIRKERDSGRSWFAEGGDLSLSLL